MDDSFNGGWCDCFVFKINPTGDELLFSGYIGGSGDDKTISIVHDTEDSIYVAGFTTSEDFPTTENSDNILDGGRDMILYQLNSTDGSMIYSSYCGGGGSDWAKSLVLDAFGNIHVAGKTDSEDFPVINGGNNTFAGGNADCFVIKMRRLNPDQRGFNYTLIAMLSFVAIVALLLILYRFRLKGSN
jgi:hypothetical protein